MPKTTKNTIRLCPARIERRADVDWWPVQAATGVEVTREPEPCSDRNVRAKRQHVGKRGPPHGPGDANAGCGRSLGSDGSSRRPQAMRNDFHYDFSPSRILIAASRITVTNSISDWSRSRQFGQVSRCSSKGPSSDSGTICMAYRSSESSVTCFTISTVAYFAGEYGGC